MSLAFCDYTGHICGSPYYIEMVCPWLLHRCPYHACPLRGSPCILEAGLDKCPPTLDQGHFLHPCREQDLSESLENKGHCLKGNTAVYLFTVSIIFWGPNGKLIPLKSFPKRRYMFVPTSVILVVVEAECLAQSNTWGRMILVIYYGISEYNIANSYRIVVHFSKII